METLNFTIQSTYVKCVFTSSSVAVLGTEHTNKVFLVYKQKDRMTNQSRTSVGERHSALPNIIKHCDLAFIMCLAPHIHVQCNVNRDCKTTNVETVEMYRFVADIQTCLVASSLTLTVSLRMPFICDV